MPAAASYIAKAARHLWVNGGAMYKLKTRDLLSCKTILLSQLEPTGDDLHLKFREQRKERKMGSQL